MPLANFDTVWHRDRGETQGVVIYLHSEIFRHLLLIWLFFLNLFNDPGADRPTLINQVHVCDENIRIPGDMWTGQEEKEVSLILLILTFSLFLLWLVSTYPAGHLSQGLQLLRRNQLELLHKVVKVLVAGVYMRLRPYAHDPVKVMYVDVHKDPEQPSQDLSAH